MTTKSEPTPEHWSRIWTLIAIVWTVLLCMLPDPRPLATPAWSIDLVASILNVQEPAARVIAAISLRMLLLGLLGMLVMRASGGIRFKAGSLIALALAPVIGIITLWLNYGHFPVDAQLKLAVVATVSGALTTLLLRKNWWAGACLIGTLGLTFGLLTNYEISDDLANASRIQVKRLLDTAPTVPEGDEGFLQLTRSAFDLAAQRSRVGDPVLENQAAVLGLSLVLGDEKLVAVADRYLDPEHIPQFEAIRARTTLHERADWSRHFWVSAGLVVLSGESRSMNIGLVKEMKDANAGGSGFSFGDLTADAAGDRFALAATRDVQHAVSTQQLLREPFGTTDLMPLVTDLPEGIFADTFELKYGGAGGALTDSLVHEIQQRLDSCRLLR